MKPKITVICAYSSHNEVEELNCYPKFSTKVSVSNEVLTRALNSTRLDQAVEANIKHSVNHGFVDAVRDAAEADIKGMLKSNFPMCGDMTAEYICNNLWDILTRADIFDCEMSISTPLDVLRHKNNELNRVNAVLSKELSVLKGRIFAAKRNKFYGRKRK